MIEYVCCRGNFLRGRKDFDKMLEKRKNLYQFWAVKRTILIGGQIKFQKERKKVSDVKTRNYTRN